MPTGARQLKGKWLDKPQCVNASVFIYCIQHVLQERVEHKQQHFWFENREGEVAQKLGLKQLNAKSSLVSGFLVNYSEALSKDQRGVLPSTQHNCFHRLHTGPIKLRKREV